MAGVVIAGLGLTMTHITGNVMSVQQARLQGTLLGGCRDVDHKTIHARRSFHRSKRLDFETSTDKHYVIVHFMT